MIASRQRIRRLAVLCLFCLSLFLAGCTASQDNGGIGNDDPGTPVTPSSGLTVDHNCTDLSRIPAYWIQQAKAQFNLHYAHTSHGSQIVTGLQRLSSGAGGVVGTALQSGAGNYRFYHDYCRVPSGQDGMRMMDGQQMDYCETYVTPELYWESDFGMNTTRSVLNGFNVNVSLWAWCSQLDYYSRAEAQLYLDRMAQLESEYPHVTFIYMTGNAQSAEINRYERNQQIRDYCSHNNKILFDFADLDCWYQGEQHQENGIPMEHPRYYGDEADHTTYASCENKARAFWWLMARLAGWDGQ